MPPDSLIIRVRNWIVEKAGSRYALWWLAAFSFSDSSFSPFPPDPLLAVLSYFKSTSWQRLAIITTISSVVGGVFGYYLGVFFSDEVYRFLNTYYQLGPTIDQLAIEFKDHAVFTLLTAAFTPIPFKVFTVSAGMFGVSFWLFLVTIIAGRAARFFIVSWIANHFGHQGLKVFNRFLFLITALIVLVVIYLVIK